MNIGHSKRRMNWQRGRTCLLTALAASVLICQMPAPVSAASTKPSADDTTASEQAASASTGYFAYEKENAAKPLGTETVALTADSGCEMTGTRQEADTIAEGTPAGKPNVLLKSEQQVTWTFSLKQSGKYALYLEYMAMPGKNRNLQAGFAFDGKSPFAGADSVELSRIFQYAQKMQRDKNGNDLIPKRVEVFNWQTVGLLDTTGYMAEPYLIALEKGTHTVTITAGEQNFLVAGLTLRAPAQPPSYAELAQQYQQDGLKTQDTKPITVQAEDTQYQSDVSIYPVYDRANASTVPNDPARIRRNVIGQSNWSSSGQWVSYKIKDVPADGLYQLTLKYRQNTQLGMSVFRNVYINGEIPCRELENVRFPFDFSWKNLTLADEDGKPLYVHLKKGTNTLKLEATVGSWDHVLEAVSDISVRMNQVYRRVIMVTSTSPDTYRDYFLEREISGLTDWLKSLADDLFAQADDFDKINGSKSSQSSTLRRAAELMRDFAEKPADIPKKLTNFRDNTAVISQWLLSNKQQPLELDYFTIHQSGEKLPKAGGGFFSNFVFSVKQFFAAFGDDYSSLEDVDGTGGTAAITVWVNDGRDQAQILKDLINDRFTSETGVHVQLNLVQGGLIESTLSGNGPDVAVNVSRGQPVNLACRNALENLSQYDLADVKGRFGSDALLPYTYQNNVYGLPLTQTFLVMFYRTDILNELKIPIPQTWDDLFDVAAKLQRKNMTVGLPYTAITAAGAVDLGVGAKDLFPTLLMQMGGRYYKNDLSQSELDSQQALNAFKKWTSFYTKYGFDLSYDFNTRFRTGEMPLAIAAYPMYGTLSAAAPEINGQWQMTMVPGTRRTDGSIDRTVGASGSAVVMFKKAKDKENCWKFMEWLTRADVQGDYGNSVENLLGPAARLATSNNGAFEQLAWSKSERAVLTAQREWVKEIPEVPGSYFTSRCMDNAFREVLYNNSKPRVSLEKQNEILNRELQRKREELSK